MSYEGAVDGAVFSTFIKDLVCPTLKAGDIVYLDNARIHQVAGLTELVAERGAEVRYLPPYPPDLSPIENCWSKLKSVLRNIGARSAGALHEALRWAWQKVTPADALGWYGHCRLCAKLICKLLYFVSTTPSCRREGWLAVRHKLRQHSAFSPKENCWHNSFIAKCREYANLLIPGQAFHPLNKPGILAAKLLDNKPGLAVFSVYKKITGGK